MFRHLFEELNGTVVLALKLLEVYAQLVDIRAVKLYKSLSGTYAVAYIYSYFLDAVWRRRSNVVEVVGLYVGCVHFF